LEEISPGDLLNIGPLLSYRSFIKNPGKFILSGREILFYFPPGMGKLWTSCSWGISMNDRLEKLSSYIRGWMGYYALSEYYRLLPEPDEWIRR